MKEAHSSELRLFQASPAALASACGMDDELDRAAKKHRLQQRSGALRAQERQRLREEQARAALAAEPPPIPKASRIALVELSWSRP